MCIFILAMVNGVCLREVAYPKAILKKADKLSKTTGTLQVMGTVSEIGSTGIDVKIDYAVYTFLADNGEAYSGMFYIQDSEVFRIGDCVTINYNRENPKENVCIDRLDYEKKGNYKVVSCYIVRKYNYHRDFFCGVPALETKEITT